MKTLPFPPPRRSIWVADLLTLEEVFEELYTLRLIDRATYVRYLALRKALEKLADEVLLKAADQALFEGDPPATAAEDWPDEPAGDD